MNYAMIDASGTRKYYPQLRWAGLTPAPSRLWAGFFFAQARKAFCVGPQGVLGLRVRRHPYALLPQNVLAMPENNVVGNTI